MGVRVFKAVQESNAQLELRVEAGKPVPWEECCTVRGRDGGRSGGVSCAAELTPPSPDPASCFSSLPTYAAAEQAGQAPRSASVRCKSGKSVAGGLASEGE